MGRKQRDRELLGSECRGLLSALKLAFPLALRASGSTDPGSRPSILEGGVDPFTMGLRR